MKQQMEIANIEAKNASLSKDAELQLNVERIRVATETEKLRASDLSQANVRAEIEAKNAEGKARAIEIEAQARANALEMEATALLFAKEKEATGLLAMYNSQADGMRNMVSSLGGNTDAFIKYTMLDKDVYEKLARANADAVRGLSPKITTWNTGNSSSNPIADIMKNLPPLVSTIYDQTGMKPPSWLMDMSDDASNTTQPDNKSDIRDIVSPSVKGKEATGALAANNLLRYSQCNTVVPPDNTDPRGNNVNKS
jgi:flotillin